MASKAVLIGVPTPKPSTFAGRTVNWVPLLGVKDDLEAVRQMLLGAAQPLEEKSIITLLDPVDTTAANIHGLLEHEVGQLKPGDTFILMLDGHGYRVEDIDGDDRDGWDEVFIASDGIPVLDDEFARRWDEVDEAVTIIGLVDTCHADTSGFWLDHPARLLGDPALPVTYRHSEGPSRLFFSASLQDEEAFETNESGPRGVMTAALTDVWNLTEGARHSYATLFGYALQLAKQYDRRQTPRVRITGRAIEPLLSLAPFSVALHNHIGT